MEAAMGARLRDARKERGLSQRELARRVDVSASLISQIEAGQTQPSVTTLYAIVSELDVSLDKVFAHEPRDKAPSPAAGGNAVARPGELVTARRQAPSTVADTPWGVAVGDDPEVAESVATSARIEQFSRNIAVALGRRALVQQPAERPTIHLEAGVTWERLNPGVVADVDFMLVTYDPGGCSSRDGTLMRHSGIECAYILEGCLTVQVGFDVEHIEAGDSIGFNSSIPHLLRNEGDVTMRAIWVVVHHELASGSHDPA